MKNLILFTFCLVSLSACKKETTTTSFIEPEFEDYVDRFFNEAAARGENLSRENLDVVFAEVENFCGLGYANYQGTGKRRVEIDPRSSCWGDRNDLEREQFMFHELGHAVLGRSHKDSFLPNGSRRSIMCSSETCGAWDTYNAYRLGQRDYYLAELFNPVTEDPEWGKLKTKEKILFKEDFEVDNRGWDFFTSGEENESNFENVIRQNETGTSNVAVINSNSQSSTSFNSWRYVIRDIPEIPVGSMLELRAKVTTKDLQGNGVSIVLRTDSDRIGTDAAISSFTTTQNRITINGTQANQDYKTTIGYFPSDVKVILIFLLMQDGSKGMVEFDDIELVSYE